MALRSLLLREVLTAGRQAAAKAVPEARPHLQAATGSVPPSCALCSESLTAREPGATSPLHFTWDWGELRLAHLQAHPEDPAARPPAPSSPHCGQEASFQGGPAPALKDHSHVLLQTDTIPQLHKSPAAVARAKSAF